MRKSFTLFEILIVLAIVTVIVSIITPNLNRQVAKSRDARRLADMATLELAIFGFYDHYGHFPRDSDAPYRVSELAHSGIGECIGPANQAAANECSYHAGHSWCSWDGGIEEMLAPFVGGAVPVDPLYGRQTGEVDTLGRPVRYYYGYDVAHMINWCNDYAADDETAAVIPVLSFRSAETPAARGVRKDTCTGGDLEIDVSDYNAAFISPSRPRLSQP